MKVVLGAPVAERAWILPAWWEALATQTLQPDEYRFVYSASTDESELMLAWPDMGRSLVHTTKLPFYPREGRGNAGTGDPNRAEHFSKLRNALRKMLLATDADVFVSLDTDVLLTDPHTLEGLVETLEDGWDVACALTYLHPFGERSGCTNAGWWMAGDPGDYRRIWRRADQNDVLSRRPPVAIDIPMACFAIRRHALAMCAYKPHECGEDLGFADNLDQHRKRVAWRTDLKATHVWGPAYLEEALAACQHS